MKKLLLLFCLLLFAAGCSTMQGYPDRSDNYESELSALSEYFKPETISECIKKTSENEKRLCRDNIVHARIRAIDINFNSFQQAATKEHIQLNVGFDWAVLGLGGAGAVIDNSNTQAILAAISGGLTGAKGSIDKNVYFEKTMPVLLAKMIALRKSVLATIYKGLSLDTTEYPLIRALNDIDDYYNAGTIPGAVIGITATSGATIEKAEKEIKEVLVGKYVKTEEGPRIETFWKADKNNEARLNEWISKNIEPPFPSIPLFIYSDKYHQERKKAIDELKIP
ncbi:MAG: hypothetical protein AB1480_05285 [Nitrospirota bacterium]